MRRPTPLPFDLAVSLNPHLGALTVASFSTQAAANAAVMDEAARYAAQHPVSSRRERLDKRGYLEIRLSLEVGGEVLIRARAGGRTER